MIFANPPAPGIVAIGTAVANSSWGAVPQQSLWPGGAFSCDCMFQGERGGGLTRQPVGSSLFVCVLLPFILDIKFVGRTSRGHTGLLIHLLSAVRALIFLARRIQPFLSLVDRAVEFCVLTI